MESLKRLARRVLPRRARRWLRRQIREVPHQLRDLGPDLRERISGAREGPPLPPAALRRRVGLTSSRAEFLTLGRDLSRDVLALFAEVRPPGESFTRWLDFGCGSGRVARFVIASGAGEISGVDVDRPAVRWARRHLGPGFQAIDPRPPLPFTDAAFDVVYAVSVFTHLDEAKQLDWLREARRVLRPGGLLIASTHHESLAWTRPDLTAAHKEKLAADGFLFAAGDGPFNDDSAFHTLPYLEKIWGGLFTLKAYRRHGLVGYQDLSAWAATAAGPSGIVEGEPFRPARST
jgi:SAM-dependent methyltransferase